MRRGTRVFGCVAFCAALAWAATPAVAAPTMGTATVVRADSFGTGCSDLLTSSCGATDGVGGGFSGSANAVAGFGTVGADAHFDAVNLHQRAIIDNNDARAQAGWTEQYLIPAAVTHVDFLYHVSGISETSGDSLFAASARLVMGIEGIGTIAFLNVDNGGDFVIRVDRSIGFISDVYAIDISTSLEVFAGINGSVVDQVVSGSATADYGHTLDLIRLDLFSAQGQITDISTIAGESGHLYRVGGFIPTVPEPPTVALLLIALLSLSRTLKKRS